MKFFNLLFTFYLATFVFCIAPSKAWIPFAKDTKGEKFKESKKENEKLRIQLNDAEQRLDKQQELIEKEEARQSKKGFKNRNNDSLLKKSANRKNKDFRDKKPDNKQKNEKEEKFPTKQPQNYYPSYPQPSIPVPSQIVNPIPNTY